MMHSYTDHNRQPCHGAHHTCWIVLTWAISRSRDAMTVMVYITWKQNLQSCEVSPGFAMHSARMCSLQMRFLTQ